MTNCKVFNAAAEKVMAELNVPVTDIFGVIQPRIKELISPDLTYAVFGKKRFTGDQVLTHQHLQRPAARAHSLLMELWLLVAAQRDSPPPRPCRPRSGGCGH